MALKSAYDILQKLWSYVGALAYQVSSDICLLRLTFLPKNGTILGSSLTSDAQFSLNAWLCRIKFAGGVKNTSHMILVF